MIESLFPTPTLVGRPVPKKTFIERLGANARLKGIFTNYIERITWVAKLAPWLMVKWCTKLLSSR